MTHEEIIEYLKIAAQNHSSLHYTKVASAIVIKGNIISLGVNRMKSHPFQKLYAKNSDSIYWHAETNAIHNVLKVYGDDGYQLLKKSDIYIVRVKKNHNLEYKLGYAKPCKGCSHAIDHFGIQNIYYSQDEIIPESYWNHGLILI